MMATRSALFSRRRLPWAGAAAVLSLLVLAACQHDGSEGLTLSEIFEGTPQPVRASKHMIVAGHPLAAEAGLDMLRAGGGAIDAAIAAEMVLSLVEPQSSGIGGGAFLIHYAAESGAIDTYDGRETAPKSANPYMFLDGTGKPRDHHDAAIGGMAVGVPGLLRMLEMAHKEYGRLPWRDLFKPAIDLAGKGFPISKRLARLIAGAKGLSESPVAGVYFFNNDGTPKAEGELLRNPDLADTLERVAREGAGAFHGGDIAKAIVKAVGGAPRNPSGMKVSDIEAYKAKKRPPVCLPYRAWLVCGIGPPSSGGITTLQILGMVQNFDLAALGPDSLEAVHLIAEAGALAFADRDAYIADPDFVAVPAAALLDPEYLRLRATGITPGTAWGRRQPGMPGKSAWLPMAIGETHEGFSTTHLSVIDGQGNAVALTASNAWTFGSRLMVRGFILNNQLTDFAFRPNTRDGALIANRAMPGKRPRSSMAPTLVFDGRGRVVMAIGSPGGTSIIGYVTKALIAALDWKLNIQSAVDSANFLSRNDGLRIEAGTRLEKMVPALEKIGHQVKLFNRASGLNGIFVNEGGLEGGADKRREGVALGD